jgi:DNA adenine methylase
MVVYNAPYMFRPVVRAWAFWTCTNQGFSNMIGTWRSSQTRHKEAGLIFNKKTAFDKSLSERLSHVQIENKDAIALIKSLDSSETFFYLDPPYVGANQGHYGSYTQEHFNNLINELKEIKGKFLLSSYPNDYLTAARKECGWFSNDKDMHLSVSKKSNTRKVEALTANYKI